MVEPSQSNMSASIKFYFAFQAAAIRLEIRGGEWKDAYMQMDGEPWKQPLKIKTIRGLWKLRGSLFIHL